MKLRIEKLEKTDKSQVLAKSAKNTLINRIFLAETGVEISYADLPRDEFGKPLPVDGWHFNVSHSENYLAIAFSKESAVGIDLEVKSHADKAARIAKKILTPDEIAKNLNPEKILEIFVLKEAYAKFKGIGLSLGFSKITAEEIKNNPAIKILDLSTPEYFCFATEKA